MAATSGWGRRNWGGGFVAAVSLFILFSNYCLYAADNNTLSRLRESRQSPPAAEVATAFAVLTARLEAAPLQNMLQNMNETRVSQQPVREIDTAKSTMTVRVFKSGLFSAFAHDHEIMAPIVEGTFSEEQPAVTLQVESARLRVVDKDVSDKDRAKIQSTMVGPEVLDTERFRDIRFKSTRVDRLGDGKWLVHGDLTLHGETQPIEVRVEGQAGHYRGSAELKQKDFGITPVRIAGGTVKVKNEVKVEFDIFGK